MASGVLLASAAAVLLANLPVAWPLRMLAELLWLSGSGFELWRVWRRYQGVSAFRLHADGSVDIEAPDGALWSGTMANGTVSLSTLAWFRYRGAHGRVYTEPMSRNRQDCDDWRRFRVICRHVAAC